jgi:hypothetical protein
MARLSDTAWPLAQAGNGIAASGSVPENDTAHAADAAPAWWKPIPPSGRDLRSSML